MDWKVDTGSNLWAFPRGLVRDGAAGDRSITWTSRYGSVITSAYDIALMSRELILRHPDIRQFTTIWMDSLRNGAFGLSNTNKLS